MAKKSSIEKEARRRRTVEKYRERRAELKAILRSSEASDEEKAVARVELQKQPRDANPCRTSNRCLITGRSRAVYRKFGISRHKFREMALWGLLPGVRKSSW